jgi:hypothetical protein
VIVAAPQAEVAAGLRASPALTIQTSAGFLLTMGAIRLLAIS